MGVPFRESGHLCERQRTSGIDITRTMGQASVAGTLAKVSAELAQIGERLKTALGEQEAALVDEGLRLLSEQVYRIAVIGQIKAGKTSFINSLIARHDLLPTDVNPWTTAITRLNFKHWQGAHAATFHFFTAEEWQQLADTGGRLGELTERFVPGFERQMLRRHIGALRARAERRLGPEFTAMLGQGHGFNEISSEILRRYVCAGDVSAAGTRRAFDGQFSDITRSAELNLEGGPFAVGTTVIDTPGTNDPFMVRDEITRSCLDGADVHLIVVSARQPLGASDIALLRILRGLHKEQVVVFINRIDELGDIRRERDAVVEFVRRRLERELPGSDIPVVAGSAWWAQLALAAETDQAAPEFDARWLAYFSEAGLVRRQDVVKPVPLGGAQSAEVREMLVAASGLPEVHAVLDRLLRDSRLAHVESQLVASFGEMAAATRQWSELELTSLSSEFEQSLVTAEKSGEELRRLNDKMTRLEEAAKIIETAANVFRKQLGDVATHETTALRGRMIGAIDRFSSREADALLGALSDGSGCRDWQCSTDNLRRSLAEEFIRGYRHAELRIEELRCEVVPQLKLLLALMAGRQAPSEMESVPRPTTSAPPRMTALSTTLVLDLHLPWWRAWWSRRPTPEERSRELFELVRSDLFPLVDELLDSCTAHLEARIDATTKWSFGVSGAIVASLRDQHERLLAHYRSLSDQLGTARSPEAIAAKRAYMAELQQRSATADAVMRDIAALAAALRQAVQPTPGGG